MSTFVRPVIGTMNYPGDCVASIKARIESGEPMGPSYSGEWLWPVEVEYDAEKHRTVVGFTQYGPEAHS